jgi:hypothetical protein
MTPRPEEVAALLRASARDSVWLPVNGTSMLPTILAGSEVRVVARARRPRIAEIWAFCDTNGTIVVHRYRKQDADGRSLFRGDNQKWRDDPVAPDRLIGLVTHVREGGKVRRFAIRSRFGWIVDRLIGRISRHSVYRPFRRRT